MTMILAWAVAAIGVVLVLTVAYWLIRMAVRDGTVDAHRRLDSESVRSQLRVGSERSPNSRP